MASFAPHAGILNRIQWMAEAFPWQKGDVALFKTSPAFVDSIWEMFGPLIAGKQLIMGICESMHMQQGALAAAMCVTACFEIPASAGVPLVILHPRSRSPAELIAALTRWKVSHLVAVPSLLVSLVAELQGEHMDTALRIAGALI